VSVRSEEVRMGQRWEVKRVTGKGFLKDTVIQSYGNLDKFQVEDIKLIHKPRAVGTMDELLLMDHLIPKVKAGNLKDEDLDDVMAGKDGVPFPNNTVYVMISDIVEEGVKPAGTGLQSDSMKKAVQQKIEDKVVQAEGDKLFKAGGANAEARKNIAQSEKMEGGVWGSKRKGPPRV
jgi:hypothetical protein